MTKTEKPFSISSLRADHIRIKLFNRKRKKGLVIGLWGCVCVVATERSAVWMKGSRPKPIGTESNPESWPWSISLCISEFLLSQEINVLDERAKQWRILPDLTISLGYMDKIGYVSDFSRFVGTGIFDCVVQNTNGYFLITNALQFNVFCPAILVQYVVFLE